MTGCYLDSNFLLYWKNEDAKQHQECVEILGKLVAKSVKLYISPLVIDEFIHSLKYLLLSRSSSTNYYEILRKTLKEVLLLPRLEIISSPIDVPSQFQVLDFMQKFSLGPRDAYHLLTITVNQIDSFATFDNDFKKVFNAKLITKP
ncbi:type II toxin-antitoxin system VapC family toxin [Candidatus Gottesmanbacteria bacterium]|nr:type II toxin-antitoxin system VapC family toxin [Candidatus Gottesmanbacteria bacterium]